MELKPFVSTLLSRHGCLVEETDAAGLHILFPEHLQKMLAVGEIETIDFPEGTGGGSLVYKGRDFIETLEPLALSAGSFTAAAFPRMLFDPQDMEGLLAGHLTVQNGIYRLTGMEKGVCSYLAVYCRLVATADTRTERLATVVINEQRHTVPVGMETMISSLLDRQKQGHLEPPNTDLSVSLRLTKEQAMNAARRVFQDFTGNLDKRLERDLTRLQQYYLTLATEIEKRLKKRDSDEERQKAISRLDATKADYLKKIQDARDKYALEITIEPVSALRLVLPVAVMQVSMQRRKKSRSVFIPMNPVTRRPESLLCAKCGEPVLNISLCDELHILCSACFPDCPRCGEGGGGRSKG